MLRTLGLSLAGGITTAVMVIDKGMLMNINFNEPHDIYEFSIVVVAGFAFVTGATVGAICSLCMRSNTELFPGAGDVFNAQDLSPEEKKRRKRITERLNLPTWAYDPVDYQLLIHPYLTTTASGNPNASQTYEQSTVIEIQNRWQGICPQSNEKITGGLLNKPLQQAIQDWLKSKSNNGANAFFSRSNARIPNWAKCEFTHKIMTNPCLTVINNEIKSVDETVAKEQRYPYVRNRFLRDAIADCLRNRKELPTVSQLTR